MSVYSDGLEEYGSFFSSLIEDFCPETAINFLKNIWLCFSDNITYDGPLDYMIYVKGNTDEVYTRPEREFIDQISQIIVYNDFYRHFRGRSITCRVVVVDLIFSKETILDSLKFMKIYNKANGDFNIYVFVSDNSIFLGCTKLGSPSDDCFLSYPITANFEWENFQDMMMYIDHDAFIDMYYNLVSTLGMMAHFKKKPEEENDGYDYLSNRINYRRISVREYDEDEQFQEDLEYYKSKLSYIHSNIVNPLELLFMAEDAEESSINQEDSTGKDYSDSLTNHEREKLESLKQLLNDPDALIKAMKEKIGL